MDIELHISQGSICALVFGISAYIIVRMFLAMSFEKPRTPEGDEPSEDA